MAASGIIRSALTGLLAAFLVACGSGDDASEDDTPEIESADVSPFPGTELPSGRAQLPSPQVPVEPELEPAPGKFPAPVETGAAPDTESTPDMEATPASEGLTVETLRTRDARPPCGGSATCQNAGSISGGAGQPAVDIFYDPERDDAIVRWGNALGGVIACADGGDTITACVDAAPFEQSCKDEFDRLSALADELAAFDAVFLTAESPCRPQEGQP